MGKLLAFFKALWRNKSYVLLGIVILLFVSVSFLSLTAIQRLQENTHVVSLVSAVGSDAQALFKKELQGHTEDGLMEQIDGNLSNLMTGFATSNILLPRDSSYLESLRNVQAHWIKIKLEIQRVRAGEGEANLIQLSEEFSALLEEATRSAEAYATDQARQISTILLWANLGFMALMVLGLIFFVQAITMRKRAAALDKLAHVDPLTQLPNRISCQSLIEGYHKRPPKTDLAVLLFDMFHLERVNDRFGHQAGDQIIADFAQILKNAGKRHGFIGRYGGDEFIALFEKAEKALVEAFLAEIQAQVAAYNGQRSKTLEHIHYVCGHSQGNLNTLMLNDMIRDADRRMYEKKRQAEADA